MYKRNAQGWTKHLDFILLDIVMVQLSYTIACLIRLQSIPYTNQNYLSFAVILSMADFIGIMVFNLLHDVMKRKAMKELAETVKISLAMLLIITLYMFATQAGDIYSRITIFLTCLIHIPISFGSRLLWKKIVRQRRQRKEPQLKMLVVAEKDQAETILQRLTEETLEGYFICGLITREKTEQKEISGIPVVCEMAEASSYICSNWIDAVYVDCSSAEPEIARFLDECREMAVPTYYHVPGMSKKGAKQFVERIGGTTVITTSINYATPLQQIEKRILDIIGGLVGSTFALIIIGILAPFIKTASPGPVLFRQDRVGKNGKIFKIIKIRSMYMDAERRKKDLMDQNRVRDGMMFKLDWDPRIIGNRILPDGTKKTGIGEFIRKTSLDEFPQFFNVLKGEMSLVGTRPPTVDEWNRYKFHHRARLACKPGITGMWQVSGRSEITDFEEVVKLDTEYISNWSMSLDLKILAKTFLSVFTGRGAM